MENKSEHRTDIDKLSILLPHWLHHNNDHIRDQENWIIQAEKMGLIDVADELRKAIDHFKKVNRHIAQADLYLRNKPLSEAAPRDVGKVHLSSKK